MTNRDILIEMGYSDSIVFDGPEYDNAIIGVNEDGRVIYDFEKMAECLMEQDGMDYEEAVEFIEYNTIRAIPYMGSSAPIVMYGMDQYQEIKPEFKLETKKDAEKMAARISKWIADWFDENGKDCKAVVGMSGGKDSTIVAALCVNALGPDRVIGVAMPDSGQSLNDADKICKYLGINYVEIPIEGITKSFGSALNDAGISASEQTTQNIPPRVRMAMLYAVAQTYNGRVANTCNLSEDYIGYSTLYGDMAGSFAPISKLTVTEVRKIGKSNALRLPPEWVDKIPDDGLPNSCPDEEKLGFTYDALDKYIRNGFIVDNESIDKIQKRHFANLFKTDMIRIPCFDPNEE